MRSPWDSQSARASLSPHLLSWSQGCRARNRGGTLALLCLETGPCLPVVARGHMSQPLTSLLLSSLTHRRCRCPGRAFMPAWPLLAAPFPNPLLSPEDGGSGTFPSMTGLRPSTRGAEEGGRALRLINVTTWDARGN